MPQMTIKPKFELEQIVYLKTDEYQVERMVIGIIVLLDGRLKYRLRYADYEPTEHSFNEISEEKRESINHE